MRQFESLLGGPTYTGFDRNLNSDLVAIVQLGNSVKVWALDRPIDIANLRLYYDKELGIQPIIQIYRSNNFIIEWIRQLNNEQGGHSGG